MLRAADARHRLLSDMGIQTWYLRRTGAEVADVGPVSGSDVITRDQEPANAAVARTGIDPAPRGESAARAAKLATAETRAAASQHEESFTVVALGVQGALLIAGGVTRAGDAALANDVVRALRRDWSVTARKAQFTWPQAAASGDPGLALAAFVEKQMEDHAAGMLLVTESVAARLGADAGRFVTIAEVETLSDPRNKAALWRRLQRLER